MTDDDAHPVKVYKVEVLIIDHDGLGPEGIKHALEHTRYPNRCISPDVKSFEEREVRWNDDHPLNQGATSEATYEELFGGKITNRERWLVRELHRNSYELAEPEIDEIIEDALQDVDVDAMHEQRLDEDEERAKTRDW